MMENTQISPLQQFMMDTGGDEQKIGERIAGVLEFLTIRAEVDVPYLIFTDDEEAMVLFATGEDAKKIRKSIPEDMRIKTWDEPMDQEMSEYLSDADPGDEADEPTPETE